MLMCTTARPLCHTCRQLSYDGAEFELRKIAIEANFQLQYSRAAAFWQMLDLILDHESVFARFVGESGKKKPIGGLFWGAHQRFFKNMLMAAKVPSVAADAKEAILAGHSVVIGLQSTGEANAKAEADEHGAHICSLPLAASSWLLWCTLFWLHNHADT
jgi:hypothetical protein